MKTRSRSTHGVRRFWETASAAVATSCLVILSGCGDKASSAPPPGPSASTAEADPALSTKPVKGKARGKKKIDTSSRREHQKAVRAASSG